ncbi:hypothetical protein [Cytobacillus kochii]|uniref:Uncharacterized protein n=1 Tax=Cytobacillus kochii TaxID=859143 RepID=A0A248TGA7_9BACI|nr:hypothetical protein [Cytobacillus kochii]ASV67223.1 hypothetical protein CKF48_07700 [Cytobacillus kochii]
MNTTKNKYLLYLDAYIKAGDKLTNDPEEYLNQIIFYGVKVIYEAEKPIDYNQTLTLFKLASTTKMLMGRLTPKEFINLFPINKWFKGDKYGMKDYFYTMNYINTLDQNELISEDISEFLLEYTNREINIFNVKLMSYMSDLRRYEGKTSFLEEWASMNNVDTYTLHKKNDGKEFLINRNTGKSIAIKKPIPKYLKRIK